MKDTRQRGYPCEKGCGRNVINPTGVCNKCRIIPCRKCGGKLRQLYIGQAIHTKCKKPEMRA